MPSPSETPDIRPYPPSWERVAELRVFRATAAKWANLVAWRTEMERKGWRLLRVTTERGEIFAVFGRTRSELRQRA
jgi:hypothetical protein